MEYKLEELVPVTAMLAEKYTSKESSSVPYETAQMLMGAVIYCIEEQEAACGNVPSGGRKVRAEEAYEAGYAQVIDKSNRAREAYNKLTADFEDYGCRNYKDTIIGGMPAFFLYYDVRFQPKNHIITLDYPTVGTHGDRCGIDLIYDYLCDIETESRFLCCFQASAVRELLYRAEERFGVLYMENLCSLVLLSAIGCIIAEHPFSSLVLEKSDMENIEMYFREDSLLEVEQKTGAFIRMIAEAAGLGSMQEYYQNLRREYALRIFNGKEHHVLDALFL